MNTTKVTCSMLVLFILLSSIGVVSAGSEDDPEIIDKTFDVKFLGLIPFFPQMNYKRTDITSVWFYEQENDPDHLYVSMKLRGFETNTDTYEYIYVVRWIYRDTYYAVCTKFLPEKTPLSRVGILDAGLNDYVSSHDCDESFDTEAHCITWKIEKEDIDDPPQKTLLNGIFAFTNIRFPLDSVKVKFDLFKDFSSNANLVKDYQIQY